MGVGRADGVELVGVAGRLVVDPPRPRRRRGDAGGRRGVSGHVADQMAKTAPQPPQRPQAVEQPAPCAGAIIRRAMSGTAIGPVARGPHHRLPSEGRRLAEDPLPARQACPKSPLDPTLPVGSPRGGPAHASGGAAPRSAGIGSPASAGTGRWRRRKSARAAAGGPAASWPEGRESARTRPRRSAATRCRLMPARSGLPPARIPACPPMMGQ